MKPLDLTKAPPRSPKDQLDGVAVLARTIDKMRASLPGGNLGEYKIEGLSSRFLERFGINEDELRAVVARADGDGDVVDWMKSRLDWREVQRHSEALKDRTIDPSQRADFAKRYPILNERPDIVRLMDMLEADDAHAFAATEPS